MYVINNCFGGQNIFKIKLRFIFKKIKNKVLDMIQDKVINSQNT